MVIVCCCLLFESPLSSAGAGGAAIIASNSFPTVAFLAPIRFQGGGGREVSSDFLVASVDFIELCVFSPLTDLMLTLPVTMSILLSATSPSSPAKRFDDDLMEMARNSARSASSSALPPRSPLNVLGRFTLAARGGPVTSVDATFSVSLTSSAGPPRTPVNVLVGGRESSTKSVELVLGKKSSSSSTSLLASEAAGGAAITTSALSFARYFAFESFCFHGGTVFIKHASLFSKKSAVFFSSKLFELSISTACASPVSAETSYSDTSHSPIMTFSNGFRGADTEGVSAAIFIRSSIIDFFLAFFFFHGGSGRVCFSFPELVDVGFFVTNASISLNPMEE